MKIKYDLSDVLNQHFKFLKDENILNGIEREYKFHPDRKWRFDFCWPLYKIACEADGGQYKPGGGRHNTDEDRDKLNHAAELGWRVFRFSANQINTNPIKCIEMLSSAIQAEKNNKEVKND